MRVPAPLAAVVVFFSSAAVLVVELVALRLLAPHWGLTLETNTLVIGMALTAIAVGSWAGGLAADRYPPRRLLGPCLAVSGAFVAATPVTVRAAAEHDDGSLLFPAALAMIFGPGALLSAVTPIATKLRLTTLAETGTVVGRLSGISTAGAIFGTVVTGFVLVSTVPVSVILVGLGAALVVSAAALELRLRGWRSAVLPAALVVVGGLGAAAVPSGCDVETTYHCASWVEDPDRPTGRVLVLDGLRHSYVDLEDPTYLDFAYVRAAGAAIDTAFPAEHAVSAYYLGGGGLTLPRYVDAVRPGSSAVVSEIDPGVVELDREQLDPAFVDALDLRVEDARTGLHRIEDASQDLVVGDAFAGISAPWHLTTREAVAEIRRVLAPGGVYVVNLIDYSPQAFVKAKAATVREVFTHVAVATSRDTLAGGGNGNLVVLASDAPVDVEAWASAVASVEPDWQVLAGTELDAWQGDADVLTDDYAPVDQLLTPRGVGEPVT